MAGAEPTMPTLLEVKDYLASTGGQPGDYDYDDDRLRSAMAAEFQDQLNRLRFPLDALGEPQYDQALREAFCRRVARNLAVRPLTLGFQATVTDTGSAAAYIGTNDPEVRRLEAAYRKLVVG